LLITSAFNDQKFLPADKLDYLMTIASVKSVLQDARIRSESLVDFVLQKARRVFLTLVYLGKLRPLSPSEQTASTTSAFPSSWRRGRAAETGLNISSDHGMKPPTSLDPNTGKPFLRGGPRMLVPRVHDDIHLR